MFEPLLKVDAWVFHLDECAISPISHPADAARAAQIADPVPRRRYARGRAALRRVLALRLGINPEAVALEIAPGGKPGVAGCDFSISHSGPWLVVAVGDTAVGVDIEMPRPRRNMMDLAERFFSARDIRYLRDAAEMARDRAFFRLWVAKEAALKCAGVGLALHLHKAECIVAEQALVGVRWDGERFSVQEFHLPDGTPGAVAWRGENKAQIEWRDPAEIAAS